MNHAEQLEQHKHFTPEIERRLAEIKLVFWLLSVQLKSVFAPELKERLGQSSEQLPILTTVPHSGHPDWLAGYTFIAREFPELLEKYSTIAALDYWKNPLMQSIGRHFVGSLELFDRAAEKVAGELYRLSQIQRVFNGAPQGTRKKDAQIHPPLAVLAYFAERPLIPVGIQGAEQLWPKGGFLKMIRAAVERKIHHQPQEVVVTALDVISPKESFRDFLTAFYAAFGQNITVVRLERSESMLTRLYEFNTAKAESAQMPT